jgi:ribosome-binding ATPase YchF (GTP1/OBG family)
MMADDAESRDSILKEYGLTETGLNKIILLSNTMLNLHTYYTVGPQVPGHDCFLPLVNALEKNKKCSAYTHTVHTYYTHYTHTTTDRFEAFVFFLFLFLGGLYRKLVLGLSLSL